MLNKYEVGKEVANDKKYRLYLCTHKETKRQCLLQIATTTEYNGSLDRMAYILKELENHANILEEEYLLIKKNPASFLNYQLGFPELLESFTCKDQGGRRVNVLAFRGVEDVRRVVPLANITNKDKRRVDLRSSAWIMGKILKLFDFIHNQNISINLVNGKNILIEPDQHYVMIFDWSFAKIHSENITTEIKCLEISQTAQAVITALGGDVKTGVFTNDCDDKGFEQYTNHLLRLARKGEDDAKKAHIEFYKLVDSLWKREFYPFTTYLI